MAVTLLHTGQTGVERGADRAARAVGIPVGGSCSYEQRDEFGVLPPHITVDLEPCDQRGTRSAIRATLQRANALVIAVPTLAAASSNAGVDALRRNARVAGVPHIVVDPKSDFEALSVRLRQLEEAAGTLRLLVTGPRITRWQAGERVGWNVVAQLALSS